MKKLLIILVGVIILFLSSVIYRARVTPITTHFPVERLAEESEDEKAFHIILFFSMNNCRPCLNVIDVLNEPPEGVRAIGIIPEDEMPLLDEVRQRTGARFPILSLARWKRYDPVYSPTLYGVGPEGHVYFLLPCVGFEESYFPGYFIEFMRKSGYSYINRRE